MKKNHENIRKMIREELARGMPEFVMDQIAHEAAEQAKRHFVKYAQERNTDAASQKKMLVKANASVKKLEEELKELLKKHAVAYVYDAS